MSSPKILIIGKRNGILQWFENLLAITQQSPEYDIQGFALNHNHHIERFIKKIIPNKDRYTATLLEKKLAEFKPDLILIADLFYLNSHLINALATSSAKKAHWIGDFFDQRLALTKDIIDLYCFTDSSFLADAEKIGIENSIYLPLAYNPSVFYYRNEIKSNRLIFVGAWSKDRQELIEQIPIPMTIYGKGWDKLNKIDCEIHSHNIQLNQVAELYRSHKYVLNVINKQNIRQGMNMRCFEAPACGCVLVSEYVEDLKYSFDLKRDIICFSSPKELQKMLNNSSIDPAFAMHKVEKNHTYKHRIMTLVDLLLAEKK